MMSIFCALTTFRGKSFHNFTARQLNPFDSIHLNPHFGFRWLSWNSCFRLGRFRGWNDGDNVIRVEVSAKFIVWGHIDTGVIDFLNDSGCIFVEFVLHCSLRLLFEQQKTGTKIRNDWYLQYHECKDIYQKGYQ